MAAKADWGMIETLTRKGLNANQVAEIVGCTPRTVWRVWARLGIPDTRPRLSDEQLALAGALLADGVSYRETARTVGCNPTTLAARFPGMGWEKGRGPDMAEFMKRLEALP